MNRNLSGAGVNLPDEVPAWALWLAQDADGTWWAYEAEPHQHHTGWYENEVGRSRRLHQGAPNPDWQNALYRVDRSGAA